MAYMIHKLMSNFTRKEVMPANGKRYTKQTNLHLMESKFKEGEVVYDRSRPSQKLIVRRFVSNVYYCKVTDNTTLKDLVYFERELMSGENPLVKETNL